jgi:hypothetical protein
MGQSGPVPVVKLVAAPDADVAKADVERALPRAANIAEDRGSAGNRNLDEAGPHHPVMAAVPVDPAAINARSCSYGDCAGGGPNWAFDTRLSTGTISRLMGRLCRNSAELSAATPQTIGKRIRHHPLIRL